MNENCALLESDTASNAASPLKLKSEKVRGTSSFEFIFVCLKIVIILTRFFYIYKVNPFHVQYATYGLHCIVFCYWTFTICIFSSAIFEHLSKYSNDAIYKFILAPYYQGLNLLITSGQTLSICYILRIAALIIIWNSAIHLNHYYITALLVFELQSYSFSDFRMRELSFKLT